MPKRWRIIRDPYSDGVEVQCLDSDEWRHWCRLATLDEALLYMKELKDDTQKRNNPEVLYEDKF